MKTLCLAVYLFILESWNSNVYAETDPCNKDVYRILPRAAYRGGACLYDPDKQTCDAALITSWYRAVVNGKDLRMQEEEAYLFECGTKWPFWMNGKHPKPDEGIVNRTLLQPLSSQATTIQVKNCHDEYFVYYLHPTAACPEAYCFGETQNDTCPPFDPCDIYEHQKINYNPGQSSYCASSSGGTCSTTYDEDWVTFRDKDYHWFLNVSSRPVRSGACESPTPMWIKEVESTDGDGVQTLQLCMGSETSDCERTVTARAKECKWFTVYEVPKGIGCGRLCLEDPSASCAVLPMLTTKETYAKRPTVTKETSTNTTSLTKETSAKLTTAKPTKSSGAQSTAIRATTTKTKGDQIKNVTTESVSVLSTAKPMHTSKKLPLSTQTSGITTEQEERKTTPVDTHGEGTGLHDDDQHAMVIAVAVAVSVVALVILIVVIIAVRRKCFEHQEKLQKPDPDDHYYLHIAGPVPPESEKGQDKDTVDNQYAAINEI